jgi:hypothetical protein
MRDIDRCYKILELEPGASSEELKRAYRDLVKVWHPDRFVDDPQLQQKALEKLKEINEAYARLQSAQPSPQLKTRQPAPHSQRPGTAPRPDGVGSRGSRARRFGLGGGILFVLACALVMEVLLSPFGAIHKAHGGYFTIGSTKDEVLAVQGIPTRMVISPNGSIWYYGLSNVHFASGRVRSWNISPNNPLKIRRIGESPLHTIGL